MSEYAAFYGTIGEQLTFVSEGQKQHSYAMVPESIYRGWKRLNSFVEEKGGSYYGTDMAEHQTDTAHFKDEEHTWSVTTAKCPHPSDPTKEFCWRYIIKITHNGNILSRSRVRFEDYLHSIIGIK